MRIYNTFKEVLQEAHRYVCKYPAQEVGGVIYRRSRDGYYVFQPIDNISTDPFTSYYPNPEDYVKLIMQEEAKEIAISFFLHSHPIGSKFRASEHDVLIASKFSIHDWCIMQADYEVYITVGGNNDYNNTYGLVGETLQQRI